MGLLGLPTMAKIFAFGNALEVIAKPANSERHPRVVQINTRMLRDSKAPTDYCLPKILPGHFLALNANRASSVALHLRGALANFIPIDARQRNEMEPG